MGISLTLRSQTNTYYNITWWLEMNKISNKLVKYLKGLKYFNNTFFNSFMCNVLRLTYPIFVVYFIKSSEQNLE